MYRLAAGALDCPDREPQNSQNTIVRHRSASGTQARPSEYDVVSMARKPDRKIRLTQPLARRDGELQPCSWDEALDRVAGAFERARNHDATKSFGMFSCSKTTNELNYAAQKFVRSVLGSNNIDSCNRT